MGYWFGDSLVLQTKSGAKCLNCLIRRMDMLMDFNNVILDYSFYSLLFLNSLLHCIQIVELIMSYLISKSCGLH